MSSLLFACQIHFEHFGFWTASSPAYVEDVTLCSSPLFTYQLVGFLSAHSQSQNVDLKKGRWLMSIEQAKQKIGFL